MKIIFLGTGSAFTLNNNQTNFLIEQNGKYLLIDAGTDIRFSLVEKALSYKDIDATYISHLHADHAGGIEYLAFCSYFDPKKEKITLYGNGELLRRGWNDSWRGGLESIQGKCMTLQDYFDISMVRPNGMFIWEGIEFHIVQAIHIMNKYALVPSYGLMAVHKGKKIFLTTDTQFCPSALLDFYKEADLIIQDCETTPYSSGVHANFTDLATLSSEIKKKMLLVHYQDNVIEKGSEWKKKAEEAGFMPDAFVPKGHEVVCTNN